MSDAEGGTSHDETSSEQKEAPRAERGKRRRMGDGLKQGLGFLSAFKDALEETIQEARERGDLSTERAKEVVKEALDRAQAAGEKARERLDFAHQSEVEALREAVDALRVRVDGLEKQVARAKRAGGGKASPKDE